MLRLALAFGLIAALFAPTAVAMPSCDAVTVAADAPVYVSGTTEDPEVWTEQNGHSGLQKVACEDASGRSVAADVRNLLLHVPQQDELPCRLSGRTLQCT